MAYTKIRPRRTTTANWESKNPTLDEREMGFEICTDGSVKMKLGDGVTAWNDLGYTFDFSVVAAMEEAANQYATNAENYAAAADASAILAANVAKDYLQRKTVYMTGDIILAADNLSKAYALLCSGSTTTGATTGTTGATAPATWAGLSGSTTDGTAVFTTIARRPTTRDQAGFTDIYTKNEVNELLNGIGLTVVDGELNITYTE